MKLNKAIFALGITFLLGCSGPSSKFSDAGAGLKLFTPETSQATSDLQNYFAQLCLQSDPFLRVDANNVASCSPSTDVLVRAGFNDIDLRCDAYLAWIDQKRGEARNFNSSVAATNTLAAGVSSAISLQRIAQALGFATSIYNTYSEDLLTGLESSTIKRIVYERRRIYREEFLKVQYSNYPDVVFALRGYLRLCTPQTIVLSANEYAFAGASGFPTPDIRATIRSEVNALTPVSPASSANIDRRRPPDLPSCPGCGDIFAISGFTNRDVELAQERLCENPDGQVGRQTIAALSEYDGFFANGDGKISSQDEWAGLLFNGCRLADRQRGIRSAYERQKFADPATLSSIIVDLNNTLGRQIPTDAGFASIREAIAAARQHLNPTDPHILDPEEYSEALDNAF